jgi:hypothetical protein
MDEPPPAAPSSCAAWDVVGYEPSPFALDVAAASQIAVAVLLIWAVGFIFRTLARHLREY